MLSVVLLGVVRAQGSGSRDHTEQPHSPDDTVAVSVLGAVEHRELPLGTTTVVTAPLRAAVEAVPTTTADTSSTTVPVDEPSPAAAGVPAVDTPVPGVTSARALADATVARISYPWEEQLRGWVVAFLPAREGLRGLTLPDSRRIEIYVRDADTPETLARVLAHELGHAVDVTRNDARDRQAWRTARGAAASVPWWPNDSAADFATLAGDFAEAFATWQTGAASESTAAGPLTDEQLALLASLAS